MITRWLFGLPLLIGLLVHAQEPARLSRNGRHLLLHVLYDGQTFRVLQQTVVNLPLPRHRVPRSYRWHVQALAADGRLQFERGLHDPTVVRGEFHHPNDPERVEAVVETQTLPVSFTLRVPCGNLRRLDFFERAPQAQCEAAPRAAQLRRLGNADLLDGE